ncbi:hypothetical protein BE18_14785 [Sorangium cellulosum]|uniref:Secreted protein n=1 Tax=Sorangium cellulosum TaxID=56 RepID=A0A150RYV7_SORCE|nr:hypothetical protein BE18_14785 [Sorangium cellulosum]
MVTASRIDLGRGAALGALSRTILAAGAARALIGCNAPEPPPSTGGTDVVAGPCGRGAVVVSSDYQSTNVSLVSWDGAVLSASIVSSGSRSSSPGLASPLSGDVVVPTTPVRGERLALLDRSASVLTWIDVRSGEPAGQLALATAFRANPQDYVEVSPGKAYVTRHEPNLDPDAAPIDGGSDVLVVDPGARAIVGRIDLAPALAGEDPAFYPRPGRAVLVGDSLYVLLTATSLDFVASAESRLVEIDARSDAIRAVTVLEGLHGCGGLAASAGGSRLAVVCPGTFGGDATSNAGEAGLVVLARRDGGLVEEARWTAAELGAGTPGFSVAFASEDRLVFSTLGRDALSEGGPVDDTLTAVELAGSAPERGKPEVLLRSKELPFSLGEVRCAEACGRCLVADAETEGGVVHRFDVGADGRALEHAGAFHVDPRVGLPPRYLGAF